MSIAARVVFLVLASITVGLNIAELDWRLALASMGWVMFWLLSIVNWWGEQP